MTAFLLAFLPRQADAHPEPLVLVFGQELTSEAKSEWRKARDLGFEGLKTKADQQDWVCVQLDSTVLVVEPSAVGLGQLRMEKDFYQALADHQPGEALSTKDLGDLGRALRQWVAASAPSSGSEIMASDLNVTLNPCSVTYAHGGGIRINPTDFRHPNTFPVEQTLEAKSSGQGSSFEFPSVFSSPPAEVRTVVLGPAAAPGQASLRRDANLWIHQKLQGLFEEVTLLQSKLRPLWSTSLANVRHTARLGPKALSDFSALEQKAVLDSVAETLDSPPDPREVIVTGGYAGIAINFKARSSTGQNLSRTIVLPLWTGWL